ncbi:protein-L-isoaspartate(D-aspartate) O-methyltransferase [Dechloromonas denitrificans]|uniref:protein-L-isoaspartate(D-aspartate) O-methyltransferase n=1 Tax=Dechloromonas denitrificans TaxID=281362 RepID=UPI001CF91E81|nr:protein-L-isoaspartate(D-aspartate) O-methyltransferase [Dechloromonas denitrificans]UCV01723.1 protein-L-isoaspartate(D-aspartate) O-methyltransferase [Dechloromonas denitrificans]UCV06091.1 protein-L-isoaspartate(D-aspartate) O-methyltransferase [Dechloromonas denitrificans]
MQTNPDVNLEHLLGEIREEVRATAGYTGRAELAERVIAAMRKVPRHAFVPDELQPGAYRNAPLPIGHGQTISQPYIVALMTDLIQPQADDVVLEIGTGSGYQAAVLALLVKQVYSLEIVESLACAARQRLQQLGYGNVEVQSGNGCFGWVEHAPYDAVIVTAGAPQIPAALVEQLKPGGRLIMPVGDRYFGQELLLLKKDANGRLEQRCVLPVLFVPLTGTAQCSWV